MSMLVKSIRIHVNSTPLPCLNGVFVHINYTGNSDERLPWWETLISKDHLFWNLSFHISMEIIPDKEPTVSQDHFCMSAKVVLKDGFCHILPVPHEGFCTLNEINCILDRLNKGYLPFCVFLIKIILCSSSLECLVLYCLSNGQKRNWRRWDETTLRVSTSPQTCNENTSQKHPKPVSNQQHAIQTLILTVTHTALSIVSQG